MSLDISLLTFSLFLTLFMEIKQNVLMFLTFFNFILKLFLEIHTRKKGTFWAPMYKIHTDPIFLLVGPWNSPFASFIDSNLFYFSSKWSKMVIFELSLTVDTYTGIHIERLKISLYTFFKPSVISKIQVYRSALFTIFKWRNQDLSKKEGRRRRVSEGRSSRILMKLGNLKLGPISPIISKN